MESDHEKPQADDAWENRKLCSDPACIGVIGADGRCKECGKHYTGEAADDGPFDETDAEEVETDYESTEASVDSEEESASDDEWADRKLCSDPACIGVIGTDGRCKECGKPYTEA